MFSSTRHERTPLPELLLQAPRKKNVRHSHPHGFPPAGLFKQGLGNAQDQIHRPQGSFLIVIQKLTEECAIILILC